MTKAKELPLIEHCEGADADSRSSLRAAWKRLQYSRKQRQVTDLHVREFIFWIWAKDVRKDGYQATYEEIAEELECKICTARNVVARASKDFGLIEVIEQRYATGSQASNRYSIDLSIVRAINKGLIEPYHALANVATKANAGKKTADASGSTDAVSLQGPATTSQGPATRLHHNKELPRLIPRLIPSSSSSSSLSTDFAAEWLEVEEVLLRLPEGRRPGDWRTALQLARQSGVTPDYVLSILRHYESQGTAYAAGALYHRLRHCDSRIAPDQSWPKPAKSLAPAKRDDTLLRVGRIEYQVCRDRGSRTDDQVRSEIANELRKAGIDPQLSDWCRAAPEVLLQKKQGDNDANAD